MGTTGVKNLSAVSELNFVEAVLGQARSAKKVIILDETIREGEETPGVVMTVDSKLKIAKMLEELGVPEIVVGLPGYIEEHSRISKAIQRECPSLVRNSLIRVRNNIDQIDRLLESNLESGVQTICFTYVSSDVRIESLGQTREQVLELMGETINKAKKLGVSVACGLVDATRADMSFLEQMIRISEGAGAKRICLYDTLAVLKPSATRWWVGKWVDFTKLEIEYHCHDDFGLAVANTCAAVEAGAQVIDTTVNGLGDRAGNCSFEETVVALECLYGVSTGIDLSGLNRLSRLVERVSGVSMPPNKAVTGRNAFIHELNGKAKSILTGRWYDFEPYHPSLVGQERTVYFGATTSKDTIQLKCQQMGLQLKSEQVEEVLRGIQGLTERNGFAADGEVEGMIRSFSE